MFLFFLQEIPTVFTVVFPVRSRPPDLNLARRARSDDPTVAPVTTDQSSNDVRPTYRGSLRAGVASWGENVCIAELPSRRRGDRIRGMVTRASELFRIADSGGCACRPRTSPSPSRMCTGVRVGSRAYVVHFRAGSDINARTLQSRTEGSFPPHVSPERFRTQRVDA